MPPATSQFPLTTADISARTGAPAWLIRRIVDALPIDIPRFNRCRAIPPDLLSKVEDELRRRGYLRTDKEAAPSHA
jgi:hypothetical protein